MAEMNLLQEIWQLLFPLDTYSACLALGPVAIYLLLVGTINLSRHPFLVSGTRDAAALGLAVSGMMMIGPIRLYCPAAAAAEFGPWVWVFLLAFYALCLALLLLLQPRLIIYNISAGQLRPILAGLVEQLDDNARWAGDMLTLPKLGVQLHVDNLPMMRNVSLKAVGVTHDHAGWRRLELALLAALRQAPGARNFRGATFVSVGLMIFAALLWAIARDPQAVAESLFEMLRLKQF